jgi:serine/threonine protein kinase
MSDRRAVRTFAIGERLFDRFEIFARYAGGMATVYGATDVEGGRRYAVKTCREHADQAVLDEAFRAEIAFGLGLEPHPGILRLRFAEALGDQLFAFFDFVDGGDAGRTLRDHIDAGAITTGLFGGYAMQIARALEFLSEQRSAAHLDLKPSNILVDAGGKLRIGDFGLSRSVELFRTDPAAAAGGTAGYMPPEQRAGGVVDERSDIYAFGVILHEMLTGAPPSFTPRALYWQGFDRAALQEPLSRELTDDQLQKLGRLVGACIDTAAYDRFQSFNAVALGITAIFDGCPADDVAVRDTAGDMLQRALSWRVIGEHSRCLRALNRLLIEYPDCSDAFEAAAPSLDALAESERASPPVERRSAPDRSPAPSLHDLFDLLPQCVGGRRYATGLRQVLRALEARPHDEKILELAGMLVSVGMGRSSHVEAEPGERLSDDLLSSPLIDSIFCQCSVCDRVWVPRDYGGAMAIVLNPVGAQCPTCQRVFCRAHFGHADTGVDSSTAVCPDHRVRLERIVRANGRKSQRLHKPRLATTAIVLYREGPLPPDLPYARKAIGLLAPDALEAGARIRTHGVVDWNHIQARREGLRATYGPPRFEIETTPATFEGERIFAARVLDRSGSGGEDAAVQLSVEPPTGDPRLVDVETALIRDVFRAHIARMRVEGAHPALVHRCARLLDARLLEPTATAALSCLQSSRRRSTVVSTAALTEALGLAVSAVPANDPVRARRYFASSYLATLTELITGTLELPHGLDVAHWILCGGGDRHVAHLCYLPFDGAATGVPALLPTDLMTEPELQQFGGKLRAARPA